MSVPDTGIGIPPEALTHVFDLFSQVDRSIERTSGGLGIGLALVKGLVEMHGGTVAVMSEGMGKGSTFTITFQVPEGPTRSIPVLISEHEKPPTNPGQRILVVDDNRDGAESLAIVLKLRGNEVSTAHDGVEAFEVAQQLRPAIILMDVGMPKLNGLDATKQIREQEWGKAILIIALTGWCQEGDRERSRAAGCNGHLVKPVSLPDLEKLLAEKMTTRQ